MKDSRSRGFQGSSEIKTIVKGLTKIVFGGWK